MFTATSLFPNDVGGIEKLVGSGVVVGIVGKAEVNVSALCVGGDILVYGRFDGRFCRS